ncbi:MAG: type II toxin-antitoxin system death-on-curing family toxin [Patescibacteria group bacterium]
MQNIAFISIEEVVIIHERMIEIGGGSSGIRDIELLHSAIERPKASFSGKYVYNSVIEMGSAMLQSLAKNHPFVDGNKRTAFFATLRFFEKNNYRFALKNSEIVTFMVSVDTKSLSVEEITDWFNERIE